MCHNGVPGPGRRAFARLLIAGFGLAALTACGPDAGSAPPPGASPTAPMTSAGVANPLSPAPASTAEAPASATAPPPSTATPTPTSTATPTAPSTSVPGTRHSLTDPASPWVVVNKHRPLSPATFEPADLVQPRIRLATSGAAALLNSTTAAAAERMFAAAAADGVVLTLASGYRSYATQEATYGNHLSTRGRAEADTASARPGYSEHQTGWSFDIGDGGGACGFLPCFAQQPAAAWAATYGHRFGFVVRYPWWFHEITGYYYEPWHLRYVGVETATDMENRGIRTLEEYFGLGAAPAYL